MININIIYNKKTGKIVGVLSEEQNYRNFYVEYGYDFVESLNSISVDNIPYPIWHYHIKDGHVTKYSDVEISEIEKYGKVLTTEERALNRLQPTDDEIRKAEQTIEILTLIQEVM